MSCWNGHMPHMTEAQLRQAIEAYTRAQYAANWTHAWQSPLNPLGADRQEPPVQSQPRRTTSLPEATAGDKAGAIEVEFVRVRQEEGSSRWI